VALEQGSPSWRGTPSRGSSRAPRRSSSPRTSPGRAGCCAAAP